jgi:hypothetical protein
MKSGKIRVTTIATEQRTKQTFKPSKTVNQSDSTAVDLVQQPAPVAGPWCRVTGRHCGYHHGKIRGTEAMTLPEVPVTLIRTVGLEMKS